jgi:hypothetical protein
VIGCNSASKFLPARILILASTSRICHQPCTTSITTNHRNIIQLHTDTSSSSPTIIHGVVSLPSSLYPSDPPSRYATVAARNSEQTAAEASAPAPQTIVPNESLSANDIASYSTGNDETSSSTSAPGGVHVINRSDLSDLNTNDSDQVIQEPGPSITVNPVIHDETHDEESEENGGLKEKLKGHRKFSKKDKEVAVYGGIGTVNLLCLGGIGYWSWRRYSAGTENGWKILGIAAGAWAGITAFEWLSMRYVARLSDFG